MRCNYPKGCSLYTSPYQEKSAVMKGQRKQPEKFQKALLLFIVLSGVTREPTHYFFFFFVTTSIRCTVVQSFSTSGDLGSEKLLKVTFWIHNPSAN